MICPGISLRPNLGIRYVRLLKALTCQKRQLIRDVQGTPRAKLLYYISLDISRVPWPRQQLRHPFASLDQFSHRTWNLGTNSALDISYLFHQTFINHAAEGNDSGDSRCRHTLPSTMPVSCSNWAFSSPWTLFHNHLFCWTFTM